MNNFTVPDTIDEEPTHEPTLDYIRELRVEIYRDLLVRHMEIISFLTLLVMNIDRTDSVLFCPLIDESYKRCQSKLDEIDPSFDPMDNLEESTKITTYLIKVIHHIMDIHGYRDIIQEMMKTPQFISTNDQIRTKISNSIDGQMRLIESGEAS